MEWIWKAVLMVVGGTILLRIAGRKSIAQMTLAQTVIMIAIGSLLIQPVAGENIWITFGVGAVLVLTLIVLEYAQIKSDLLEKWITGKSVVLIENGQLVVKNLKKYRLTVDQLEMQLRKSSIGKISDVQWATIEPNGQLGYMLKEPKQTATKEDIKKIMDILETRLPAMNFMATQSQAQTQAQTQASLFSEVANNGHKDSPPQKLQ
ncbi:DUF421 domain-containing protein [Ammoniphilus sp. YIM 78166]|uniref:DUF421 domain-containing protein n=1 Tax=Ammoniphilus sp. YIM 78166 TaxID=1644106 RepID=UPI00106F1BB6|nr:DUF421 domain-containing protein [Ammoniphilus sp. YIM 78166]